MPPITRAAAATALSKPPGDDQPDSHYQTPSTTRTRRASAPASAPYRYGHADDYSSEYSISDEASPPSANKLASGNPNPTDTDTNSVTSVDPARSSHSHAPRADIRHQPGPHGTQGPQQGGTAPTTGFAYPPWHSAIPMGVYPTPTPFHMPPGLPQLVPQGPIGPPPSGYTWTYMPPVPPAIQGQPRIPALIPGNQGSFAVPEAPNTQPAPRWASTTQANEVVKMLDVKHFFQNSVFDTRRNTLELARVLIHTADLCDSWGVVPPIHSAALRAIDVAAEFLVISNATPPYAQYIPQWLQHIQDVETATLAVTSMGPRHWAALLNSVVGMSSFPDDNSGKAKANDRDRVTSLIAVARAAKELTILIKLGGAEPDETEAVEIVHAKTCARLRDQGFAAEVNIHLAKPLRPGVPNLTGAGLLRQLKMQYAKAARTIDRAAADRFAIAGPPATPRNPSRKDDPQSKPPRERNQQGNSQSPKEQPRREQSTPAATSSPAKPPPASQPQDRLHLVDKAYDYTPEGTDTPTDPKFQCGRCGSGKHFAAHCPCPEDRQHKRQPRTQSQKNPPRGQGRPGKNQ